MFNPFKRKAPQMQTATAAQQSLETQTGNALRSSIPTTTALERQLQRLQGTLEVLSTRIFALESHLEGATSFKRCETIKEAIDEAVGTLANLGADPIATRAKLEVFAAPAKSQARELSSHRVNDCNEAIKVEAIDGPGPGGANHIYNITIPGWETTSGDTGRGPIVIGLPFQNGAIKEVGTNGVTHEAVLAVLEDRLFGFQSGPYANNLNAAALYHIQAAQRCLKMRTKGRVDAGVEGTMQPDRKNWPGRRRDQLLSFTPAELVLFDAVKVVEEAGAHPLLTDALLLVQQARAKVADFVDLPPQK